VIRHEVQMRWSMRQVRRLSLPLLSVFLAAFLAAPASAEGWETPFKLRGERDIVERKTDCPEISQPVLSLDLVSKYGDDGPERDDIDEEAEAAFETAMQPVRDYANLVVRSANRFTDKGRSGDGRCTVSLLFAWAKAGALADPKNDTAIFKLATTIAGLSSAYLQVRAAAEEPERRAIDQWLSARATLVKLSFEGRKKPSAKTSNHRAWAGLALAMTGLSTDREDLIAWGMESFESVICHADRDGSLPTETKRGKRARDYHLFALAPLVMLAEIGAANGKASYETCENALPRAMDFTLAALTDPSAIEELAGIEQAPFPNDASLPPANRLAFIEAYLARFPDAVPQKEAIIALRPLKAIDLGGDMTLLFRKDR
jgi:poly(beta-D-mannuronate) lyase